LVLRFSITQSPFSSLSLRTGLLQKIDQHVFFGGALRALEVTDSAGVGFKVSFYEKQIKLGNEVGSGMIVQVGGR
jgi:hypothetical protein